MNSLPDPPEVPVRTMVAGPAVALVTLLAALLAAREAGVSLRDPEYAVVWRLTWMGGVVAGLVVLDVVVRAGARSGSFTPSLTAIRSVRRERWPWRRAVATGGALAGFYVTYLAYRNLKSIVPLLRPGELFDRQLGDVDRGLFGGHDPSALLHGLLGTGIVAEVLSVVYYAFFYFAIVTLPLALVFSPSAQGGIFYALALSIDWVLGAASYYLLPALGPIYATPGDFAALPATDVSHLQGVLLRQRDAFLIDPAAADAHQGIGAFASLHTAILFTAAIAAHMLGLHRALRAALWALFALTALATVYLGWHYVVDDLAGIAVGLAALALARGLTGYERRTSPRGQIRKRPAIPALDAPLVETPGGKEVSPASSASSS